MKTVLVYGMNNFIGGIESFLLNVYKQIRNNIKFVFLVENTDDTMPFIHKAEIEKYGGEYHFLPEHHQLAEYIKVFRSILKEYKKETNTIYFNINYISFDIIPISIATSEKYRVITHSHNTSQEPLKKLRYHISTKLRTIYGMSRLKQLNVERLAITKLAGEYLYRGKSFEIVSPGIEANRFIYSEETRNYIRRKLRINNCVVLGFVGRIMRVKNPLFLIDILIEAKKILPDVKLMVVGDGIMRDEMVEKVKKCKLTKDVIFTGLVKSVEDYIAGVDILLAPSYSEGLGLGIIEAQSMGIPCVCAKGNVPNAVNVTKTVEFCELNAGSSKWAEKIKEMSSKRYDRNEMHIRVEECDFNVTNSAHKLLQIIG